MPKEFFDVISIGSATADIIIKSPSFKVVKNSSFTTKYALCEIYDSKVNIANFTLSSGGGATNTSSSLSHFGLNTACISKTGNDLFKNLILSDLKKFGVNSSYLKSVSGKDTAVSVILASPEGGRTALVHRGASESLHIKDFLPLPPSKWAFVSNLGGDFKNVSQAIQELSYLGVKVFWNPGLNELTNFDTVVLQKVSILSLNLEEASLLSQVKISRVLDILKFFQKFSNLTTLVTLGSKGAFAVSKKEILHIDSYKVKVVNSLGAGDAFGSGFLFGFIKKGDKKVALEYGIKNAATVIQYESAKGGFLSSLKDFPRPKIKSVNR